MTHVWDVAAYILRQRGSMTAMKLQKLCYYAYGYHLAWEERRLFPEKFEAWANGPVCPKLYELHQGKLQLSSDDLAGDPDALDSGERESVDLVLNAYGQFSAHQLSAMTHSQPPWEKARLRAKAGPLERSSEKVTDEEIFEFFDALTSADSDAKEA